MPHGDLNAHKSPNGLIGMWNSTTHDELTSGNPRHTWWFRAKWTEHNDRKY